jgi:putative transposase
MPRRRRIQFPGAIYHLMTRGNRKCAIYHDDTDRLRFLQTIETVAERYEFHVYALCLMDNHYHLVGETPRGNIARVMQYLNGFVAQASNRRHHRTGHLFEGRYRALVIERERYLRRVARYVVLNPVRAGMTPDAVSWPWSTYGETAGLRPPPPWLKLDWLEWSFKAPTRTEAQSLYRAFVNGPAERKWTVYPTAFAVASKRFSESLLRTGQRSQCRPPRRPAVTWPPSRPLSEVIAGVDAGSPDRDRAMWIAHRDFGFTLAQVARHLGLDASTVSKALRRWRDRGEGAQ